MKPRLALVAFALYLVLALASAASKAPWVDEGWFASPAYNLITYRDMGTRVLEPAGTWLEGVARYTYWIMPAHVALPQKSIVELISPRNLCVLCVSVVGCASNY